MAAALWFAPIDAHLAALVPGSGVSIVCRSRRAAGVRWHRLL
jgi:hypothetical protein